MEAHFLINYHNKFQVSTILYSVFYIISRNPFFFGLRREIYSVLFTSSSAVRIWRFISETAQVLPSEAKHQGELSAGHDNAPCPTELTLIEYNHINSPLISR